MKELKKQNALASRNDVMTGALFGKSDSSGGKRAFVSSMARSVASGLYNRTFGYLLGGAAAEVDDAADEEEYICIDYLDRQCEIFVRWALTNKLNLISRAKAKLSLQKSTSHTLDDIELLLKHLQHSGRILVEKVSEDAGDENTIIKFVQPNSDTISKKEIAIFSLEQTMKKIEDKLDLCIEKTKQEDLKIKNLLLQKNKNGAMLALQRRKLFETEMNRQQGMLNNLI